MKKTILILVFVVLLSCLVFAARDNDVILWNVADNSPSRLNDTIIWNPSGVVDSCIYVNGNFTIDCNENCTVSIDADVGGNNVLINGNGVINITANITNYARFDVNGTSTTSRCEVHFR